MSTLFGAAGVGGLFALAVVLIIFQQRMRSGEIIDMQKRLNLQSEEIAEIGHRERRCTERVSVLIVAMQRAGVEIPDAVWRVE